MSDKIWNGGKTNKSKEKEIREWNKMIRQSEDYIDTLDIEKEFNLSQSRNLTVIGNGNIFCDIARILLQDPSEFESTDMPQHVI